jgi:hypothetical protein
MDCHIINSQKLIIIYLFACAEAQMIDVQNTTAPYSLSNSLRLVCKIREQTYRRQQCCGVFSSLLFADFHPPHAFQYGGSTGSLSRATSSQRLTRQDSMPTQLTQLSRQPSLSGGAASLSGQPVPRPVSRSSDGFSRQSSFRRDADRDIFSDSNATSWAIQADHMVIGKKVAKFLQRVIF